MRLVFVADKADDASGLRSFELPLRYIESDKFNQPLFFGANNLTGKVWPAVEGGGPRGEFAPHDFKLTFKDGGCGTIIPLYLSLVRHAREQFQRQRKAEREAREAESHSATPSDWEGRLKRAFVDPSDPSTIFLAQPANLPEVLPTAPQYEEIFAPNYGVDEEYEPIIPSRTAEQR